jgi:hypothetical protein
MTLFQLGSDLVGAAGWGMRLEIDGTGHPVFSIVTTNPSPAQFDAIGDTVLSLDTEYVLLGVYTEGVGLSVSINGVLDGYMATTTTTLRHLNNSFIGANRVSSNTLTNFFNGVMYYTKLWDGATQIAEWNMQTGYGSSLYDTIGSFVNHIYGATWIVDDETGFNFHALTDDGTGVPRFGTYYNGRPLFVVDPTSGIIYFGEHFWYDPSDGAIHTPNNKTVIRADGTIEAVNGRFSGDVIANSGVFKGIFDTTALKLEPGDTTAHNFTQASSMYQARNFFNALTSFGLKVDTFYKASTSVSSIQMYTQMPTLDNTSTIDLSDLSYIRITSAIHDKTTIYHLQLFDSAKALIPAMPGWPFNSLMYYNSNNYAMTTTSFTITVYTGGDKLILSSDIPDNPVGLADYQIYHSDGTLCIKLP